MSSMKSVTFTDKEQFNLVIRQVRKLYEHKTKTDARAVRRKEDEYRMLKSLLNKLDPMEQKAQEGPVEIVFNRKEARALQALCLNGVKLLEGFIIPGYQERMDKAASEAEKANYQTYKARGEATRALYGSLLERLN